MGNNAIEIPSSLIESGKLTLAEIKLELAIRLYQQNKITIDQAKTLAAESAENLEDLLWHKQGKFDLDAFLHWASHDLKTPLNAVIGFTKVVIKGIDGPVNETQITDLTSAHVNGQRMLYLLNMLVDIARLNTGEIVLQREETNLSQLLNDSISRWQAKNPTRQLNVESHILNPLFSLDNLRTRQALSHLLTFASQHTLETGQLNLSITDSETGCVFTLQAIGEKAHGASEMDTAMLSHIAHSLLELQGGKMEALNKTEDGISISFSLAR